MDAGNRCDRNHPVDMRKEFGAAFEVLVANFRGDFIGIHRQQNETTSAFEESVCGRDNLRCRRAMDEPFGRERVRGISTWIESGFPFSLTGDVIDDGHRSILHAAALDDANLDKIAKLANNA